MKKTNTKKALGMSLISLLACGVMFAGSTYAWFTDEVVASGNKIESGTLKADMEVLQDGQWVSLKENPSTKIFDYDRWEPGYTASTSLRILNEGNLGFRYQVTGEFAGETFGPNGESLQEVIDVYMYAYDFTKPFEVPTVTDFAEVKASAEANAQNIRANGWYKVGTLADWMALPYGLTSGYMLPEGADYQGAMYGYNGVCESGYTATVVLHMQEEAGNAYQGLTLGDVNLTLKATQWAWEKDGFGDSNYDLLWDGSVDTKWYNNTATELTIDTPAEFAGFASLVNGTNGVAETFAGKTITLDSDLDLNNVNWEAIGNPMADNWAGFEGTFDGQGHTISNLSVNNPSAWGQGLFGYIASDTAVIKNLKIKNVNINGEDTSGAVAGYAAYGTFENITVTGDVNITGAQHMGGIVGNGYYANFSNCTVDANEGSKITATSGSFVGGIVGYLGGSRYVKDSTVRNLELSAYGAIGTITGIVQTNSEISGCTAENIVLNKTSIATNPSIGLACGTWTTRDNATTVISNNTFKNITLNGKYVAAAGEVTELFGSNYSNEAKNNVGTFENNVTSGIVNNLQEVVGVTGEVNMDSALGSTATGDVKVGVAKGGNMVWTTGASHGSTPFGAEDINSVTIIGEGAENSSITFVGSGVGPVRANGNGVLTVKDVTVIDETVSYAENSWEFGYLEIGTGNSEVVFENVVFESAIMIGGAKASFINCTFKSPVANEYAVWVDNGNVSFEGCTFVGNRGLKIHEAYGSEVASVVVNNCVFDNLLKKPGIAIGDLNAATKVAITNSQFINCQAGDQGLYIYETDTDVTTFDFTSTNNIVE